MSIFICSKCGATIEKNSYSQGSPCKKGRFHQWYKVCSNCPLISFNGAKVYQCQKCGVVLYSKEILQGTPCKERGFHSWQGI